MNLKLLTKISSIVIINGNCSIQTEEEEEEEEEEEKCPLKQ